ncbi:hypothetical protein BGZ99_003404 [Dissophora globulifera]|uniref:BAR-domain-containing protein n=1 Tax=Dissophora globulifera TaxID=979702 RepID=A0A9P6RPZ6_9FUNG|nr:hypothetical protein BGZ99_003404 [Dissophora globulifera]
MAHGRPCGQKTKDAEFLELNARFTTCEKVATNLLTDVCKYRDMVTAMLNHQAEFGIVLAEVYDPSLGMPTGEVTPRRVQTAPESLQAVDDFQAVMREMRDVILPEVDKLEMSVVRPLTEMLNNMKLIRKTITKRDHKLIDYDRFRISLKKLQDKKDRTLSDEKQIYKLESQLEVATADYEGLNGLLREELPGFFYYKNLLMEPIFHTFYYLQLRIYNIMMDRMGPLANNGYFDLTRDVVQGYDVRKPDTLAAVECVENITRKSATAAYASKYARPAYDSGSGSGSPNPADPSAPKPWQAGATSPVAKPWQAAGAGTKPWQAGAAPNRTQQEESLPPPPAYNSLQGGGAAQPAGQSAGSNSRFQPPQAAAGGLTKRSPPPVPSKSLSQIVVALYDYEAQQEGDLSFRKDDRIEIVQRTADNNDWWTGRINGRQGVFPGNYVQDA